MLLEVNCYSFVIVLVVSATSFSFKRRGQSELRRTCQNNLFISLFLLQTSIRWLSAIHSVGENLFGSPNRIRRDWALSCEEKLLALSVFGVLSPETLATREKGRKR